MRIIQNYQTQFNKPIVNSKPVDNTTHENTSKQTTTFQSYPAIYFTGKFDPQRLTPKRINFPAEKDSLVNQFDKILQNEEADMTPEELHLYQLNKTSDYLNKTYERLLSIYNSIEVLKQLPNTQHRYESALMYQRELKKLQYAYEHPPVFKPKVNKLSLQEAKMDSVLINKFKSAVLDDNYDFRGVYLDYYSGLNDIKSINELKKKYPKIEIPKNPAEVVSKKITESLTRDFYLELDEIHKTGDKDAYKECITNKVHSVIEEQLKKATPEEKKEIKRKLTSTTSSRINKRFKELKENDSINSVPIKRKQNLQVISDIDKKVLTVDYNDFVLSTIREQYLNFKKPNDVIYTYNKGKKGHRVQKTLKVSELKNSDYKFPKTNESLKSILTKGDELKFAQRNYDCFTKEEFIDRLEFHADRQESNEKFLDTLIKFSSCRFEGEDIDMVKKFLREADDAIDGKKTVEDVVSFTERNQIGPRGTERLTYQERHAKMLEMREEQKRHSELKRVQQSFDDNINLFYLNDMTYTAELCSEFRPKTLDEADQVKPDYISAVTKKYIDPNDNTKIINKDRLAKEISRWKKYCDYKENGTDNTILEKAEKYATDKKGKLDYDKAGQYISNYEAVNSYPQSFECATNREVSETIMEHFRDKDEKKYIVRYENGQKVEDEPNTDALNIKKYKGDKDRAVEYHCKYDDYLDLTSEEKSKIKNILNIFDKKLPLDKKLLKLIVLKDYAKVPTTEWATMNEAGSKKVLATIAPKGKEILLTYHDFPECIDYFEEFEDALSRFATTWSTPGIKKLDDGLYELKVLDYEDRFVAKNDNYYFDNYYGSLHKKKTAKQKLKR